MIHGRVTKELAYTCCRMDTDLYVHSSMGDGVLLFVLVPIISYLITRYVVPLTSNHGIL